MKTTEKDIISYAQEVWEVMHREAKTRGMALTKQAVPGSRRPVDGRIFVATIGAFIKTLSKERGWNLNEKQVDLVRRFMRDTGNVVTLNRVEQYRFRIFVAEEWQERQELTDKQTREPDAIDKRAEKLTPKDAGEDREPATVEHKCATCGAGPFVNINALNGHKAAHAPRSKPKAKKVVNVTDPLRNRVTDDLNVRQAKLLMALAAYGGEIYDKKGGTSPIWSKLSGENRQYVSPAMKHFVEHGYVTVERRTPKTKSTLRVTMTDKAWDVVNKLGQERRKLKEEVVPEVSAASSQAEQVTDVADFSDFELLEELKIRLVRPDHDAKKMASLEERLELIMSLVEEVNEGKCTPLKALADIQEAVTL